MYVIQGDIILQLGLNQILFPLNYAYVQCMSELWCKIQVPAFNTVGGVVETITVLQSVTDRRMHVRTDKGKTICPSPLHGGGIKTRNINDFISLHNI